MKKLYLLLGQEHCDKMAFIEQLKKRDLQACFTLIEKLSAQEKQGEDILLLIQNKSLFTKARLLIVEEAEKINNKLVPLMTKSYAKSGDILILLSQENKLPMWENTKDVKVEKKVFYPLNELDKKSYILKLAQEYKRRLSPAAAEYFVLMAGTDKKSLNNFATLILPNLPSDQLIDENLLANYIVHTRTETPYTLFYSILQGDLAWALLRLNHLLQARTETIVLISQLLWQLRRLLKLAQRGDKEEEFARLRIFHSERRYYKKALTLYKEHEIASMINLSLNYELRIRDERSDRHLPLLQTYLYELIIKKGVPLQTFNVTLPLVM